MISALKAEMRKLLTVRSTYIILALSLAILVLIAGYAQGYRLSGVALSNPNLLQETVIAAISTLGIFAALISILLMTHEYRYNTILYSLTANKGRSVLLAAKLIIITIFSLLFAAAVALLAPLLTMAGVALADNSLATQSIAYSDIVWRSLFFIWGYATIALVLAVIIRSQIGTIITLFFVTGAIEGLLMLVLKENVAYLPFNSLAAVIVNNNVLTSMQAAGIFSLYLLGGSAVAWALLLRRDAN